MKKSIIFIIVALTTCCCFGQEKIFNIDSINNHFLNQLAISRQEKIHVHTDRSLYIQGEQVWFKIYLVDAVLHQATHNSRYVYVELINQQKNVISRVKIRPTDNLFYGHLDLPETLIEGEYVIRAYTKHMENLGEDYFFTKNITVISPVSLRIKVKSDFEYNEKNEKITVRLSYTDNEKQVKLNRDILRIKLDDKPQDIYYSIEGKNVVRFSFDKAKTETIHAILNIDGLNFKSNIVVPKFPSDFDVAFFPEGGYLLEGTNCCIAYKALNSNGTSEKITVKIMDSDENILSETESLHLGMGKFYLVPENGKKYYALCKNNDGVEKRFEIPQTKSNTYSLKASWVKDNLYITVQKSDNIIEEEDLYILIHTRGITQYAQKWDFSDQAITLNRNDISSGVLQIILFDSQLNPISERLVFNINDEEKTNINLTTNKQNYEAREKINTKIKITDVNNISVKGNFSVSVTDNSDIPVDTSMSIMSTLLLTSDIKGHIENPNFYFQNNNKIATEALDILMQTQGWRRYNVPEILKGYYSQPKIDFETSQKISGRVQKYSGSNKTKEGTVMLYSKDPPAMDYMEVDSIGKFSSGHIEFPDSMIFTVQAFNAKGKRFVELFVDSDTFPKVNYIPKKSISEIKKEHTEIFAYEKGTRIYLLEELIVMANRKKAKSRPWYSSSTNSSFTSDQIIEMNATHITDILRRIPQVSIVGNHVRNSSRSLFNNSNFGQSYEGMLDVETADRASGTADAAGNIIIYYDDMVLNSDIDGYDFDAIDINLIERVDLLKGFQSQILGGNTSDIVILIKSKDGKGMLSLYDKMKFNLKKITPLGYQQPAEFYSPKYQTTAQKNDKTPDLRTTVYWNPAVKINNIGEAIFDFYSADYSTTYSIVIEGITADGKIIQSVNKIERTQ
jgi:Large extracellular alpha-helical protein